MAQQGQDSARHVQPEPTIVEVRRINNFYHKVDPELLRQVRQQSVAHDPIAQKLLEEDQRAAEEHKG